MDKITKTLQTSELLQRNLTQLELWDLFHVIYRNNTELLRLEIFFYRMFFISGNDELNTISSRIWKIYKNNHDINCKNEQHLRMNKNIKIELVAQLMKSNSEIENILKLIQKMCLSDYFTIFNENINDKNYGFELMRIKYNSQIQSKANHLKIVFRKTSC
jgi:hypothetical protein